MITKIKLPVSSQTLRSFIQKELNSGEYIDGNLSIENGFLPHKPTLTFLPKEFTIWNEVVQQVPQLFYSNRSQDVLEQLPVLDTDKLDNHHLPYAAIVISILASAYWRHGLRNYLIPRNNIEHGTLPSAIEIPWRNICVRLKRNPMPYQSGCDLFLNNFKFVDDYPYQLDHIKIENITPLVSSFGNMAERVFYMSFVEIHAILSPIIQKICTIEELFDDTDKSSDEKIDEISIILDEISELIKKTTRVLMKISPVAKSKTYCDPVLWSKTVGVFALAPSNYPQGGTSGTSTPMLHVLDALINREKYDSFYGKYVIGTGFSLLDIKTQKFVSRMKEINFRNKFITLSNKDHSGKIIRSFNNLIDEYCGKGGFLDKHVSKVFNYLGVATLSGRNQSTSGHERYISSETWIEVSNELKISILERKAETDKPHTNIQVLSDVSKEIMKSEVARHYKTHDGWIIIDGNVFDISSYLSKHPGGSDIIASYLGRDCSNNFNMISGHNTLAVGKMLSKFKCGVLSKQETHQSFIEYEGLIYYLQKTYALLHMTLEREIEPKLHLVLCAQTHQSFIEDYLVYISQKIGGIDFDILDPKIDDEICNANLNDKPEQEIKYLYQSKYELLKADINLVEKIIHLIFETKNSFELKTLVEQAIQSYSKHVPVF